MGAQEIQPYIPCYKLVLRSSFINVSQSLLIWVEAISGFGHAIGEKVMADEGEV